MSIRLRLTLIYTIILTLTLLIFGLGLYWIQSEDTMNALKQDIVESSEKLVDAVIRDNSGNHPPGRDPLDPPQPKPFDEFSSEKEFSGIREREIARVLDPLGNLLASPTGISEENLPLSEKGLAAVQNLKIWWEEGEYAGESMLIYSKPVVIEGRLVNILQLARSLAEHDRSLRTLAVSLAFGGGIVILLAFGAGWVLSGASLRPIDRITKTASAIGEERDFHLRVDHSGPEDEVGRLAGTFNGMLENLQDAYEKVEFSLQQQRNFVSDVSHELRTPLTTLRGNLALLLRKPPAPEDVQEDILTDMVDESDRLIRLVNDLLLMAHVDAGQKLPSMEVEVQLVLEDVIRQVRALDATRQFESRIRSEQPVVVNQDAFKQVLLIVIDNALKYSTDVIEIKTQDIDTYVEIEVVDKGDGISAEDLEHVFDRFYRAETSAYMPGFGLGLAIAKGLVGAIGGDLEIKSVKGEGTTVVLRFPIK